MPKPYHERFMARTQSYYHWAMSLSWEHRNWARAMDDIDLFIEYERMELLVEEGWEDGKVFLKRLDQEIRRRMLE